VTEPLRLSFEVACPAAHAFAVWTERISTWWPAGHTVSAEPGVRVVIEPRVGGRIYERTAGGTEHDWGQVTAWDPPRRLGYRWHLRQDRADATDVEITFADRDGGATLVEIEHRGWERLGERGPGARQANSGGWQGLLPHYTAACATPR
jgi:uncharacterized protein YndB with AHSA1/START domain